MTALSSKCYQKITIYTQKTSLYSGYKPMFKAAIAPYSRLLSRGQSKIGFSGLEEEAITKMFKD